MPCPLLRQNALFCCIFVFATMIVTSTHGTQGHDNIQSRPIQPHHQQQHHPHAAHQSHASHNHHGGSGGHNVESRSSYAMLSQAMSQAVSHEFSSKFLWFVIADYRYKHNLVCESLFKRSLNIICTFEHVANRMFK